MKHFFLTLLFFVGALLSKSAYLNTEFAYVREDSDYFAKVADRICAPVKFDLIAIDEDWAFIFYNDNFGWIPAVHVTAIQSNDRVIVKRAEVYDSPSNDAICGYLYRGAEIKTFRRLHNYVEIAYFNNQKKWIDISSITGFSLPPQISIDEQHGLVTIYENKPAKIRPYPDYADEPIGALIREDSINVLRHDFGWVKIAHRETIGWVESKFFGYREQSNNYIACGFSLDNFGNFTEEIPVINVPNTIQRAEDDYALLIAENSQFDFELCVTDLTEELYDEYTEEIEYKHDALSSVLPMIIITPNILNNQEIVSEQSNTHFKQSHYQQLNVQKDSNILSQVDNISHQAAKVPVVPEIEESPLEKLPPDEMSIEQTDPVVLAYNEKPEKPFETDRELQEKLKQITSPTEIQKKVLAPYIPENNEELSCFGMWKENIVKYPPKRILYVRDFDCTKLEQEPLNQNIYDDVQNSLVSNQLFDLSILPYELHTHDLTITIESFSMENNILYMNAFIKLYDNYEPDNIYIKRVFVKEKISERYLKRNDDYINDILAGAISNGVNKLIAGIPIDMKRVQAIGIAPLSENLDAAIADASQNACKKAWGEQLTSVITSIDHQATKHIELRTSGRILRTEMLDQCIDEEKGLRYVLVDVLVRR